MNTVWMLVIWALHTGMTTVPVAFPTQESCDSQARRVEAKFGGDTKAICVKRDGDG